MDSVRFIADVHLASLAKDLRLLGFDTLYFRDIQDSVLLTLAHRQGRIVLTKDKRLVARDPDVCYLVQAKQKEEQLKEVVQHFHLTHCRPFTRCLVDNTLLQKVSKEEVLERLPPKVQAFYEEFWICPTCQRVYWHGTHYERMKEKIKKICKT